MTDVRGARVLGIDPGLQTGLCVRKEEPGSGLVALFEVDRRRAEARERVLWDALEEANERHGPFEAVFFEEPVMRGKAGASMNRTLGVILLWCQTAQVSYAGVNPQTLKAWASKGGATKKEMAIAAEMMYGTLPETTTDNMVDAAIVAAWGVTECVGY